MARQRLLTLSTRSSVSGPRTTQSFDAVLESLCRLSSRLLEDMLALEEAGARDLHLVVAPGQGFPIGLKGTMPSKVARR